LTRVSVRLIGCLAAAATGCLAATTPATAQVFLTQEEALRVAFPPPATVERETAFLDEDQLSVARRLAGDDVRVDRRVVNYYVGRLGSESLGVAYFDAHRVRTMTEVAMVVVTPEATIGRVEVLSFLEPPEYRASGRWIDQLSGVVLTEDLAVDRGIVNLTGATLTAGALTRASRRILALDQVIRPRRTPGGGSGG